MSLLKTKNNDLALNKLDKSRGLSMGGYKTYLQQRQNILTIG